MSSAPVAIGEVQVDTFLLNPFSVERHELVTSLTPAECVERLKARAAPSWHSLAFWRPPAGRSVRGWVSARAFWLYEYGYWYRNAYQTEASGKLTPTATGTRVVVHLALNRVVLFGILVAFVAWLLMLSVAVAAWQFSIGAFYTGPLIVALFLLAFLTCVIGLYPFGRWLARDEGGFLLSFLRATLDAKENE